MPLTRPSFPGILIAGWLLAGAAAPAFAATQLPLLPLPKTITPGTGSLRIDGTTAIRVPAGDAGARNAAERLGDLLAASRDIRPAIGDAKGAIRFVRTAGLKKESYRLDVTSAGATIVASDDAGLLYGAITLWQLASSGEPIPATRIDDAPRFAWRGLMLDSARHFQSPAFVKQLIDWMAAHKLNTLHWHLVDDQGWRLEIKKYPRLTETSGWRIPASAPGAPALPRTGGFYTQDEVREIVAYAAARAITIVPEIEMPGHAVAPIRAYPELGVGPPLDPGVESDWGVFPWLYNIDDSTFGFLEDVLTETMALFPSAYIHIGGDEAVKDQWQASPAIQAKMRALGVTDEKALQSWFIHRIELFLSKHGRRLIGWDEILEGGLAPNATVMSWRGIDGAIAAAKAGHDTVLSPAPTLYLDHRQSVAANEPPGRGVPITLADVYAFDPAPTSLSADEQRHILGVQANLWTEHVRTEKRTQWMLFPRASAVAELGWSARDGHDYRGFVARLAPQLERLQPLGLNAATSAFVPMADAKFDAARNRITVTLANQAGSDIRYTVDGRMPTATSPRYTAPIDLHLPSRLRAIAVDGARVLPGMLDESFDEASVRRRDDTQLKTCTSELVLRLEDDAPAAGPRAKFLTDIMNPCWQYEAAPMDGVTAIAITVGQIPFNFQIGKEIEKIRFRPPATAEGEVEVRIDGCDGAKIATLPLAPATANAAVTTLRATIAPQAGARNLCFTYTANGPDPMWGISAVQLETRK
ncbi:hexosaminidase [Sphingomonas laterariae]|uniref:beta-N-acetylhexosaminidase n=1 Tax=Edaphosphingomonas laterariae TaxID=861865 RepID=A0A239ELT9_9SPHN|nr:family 20 glycosylhydrolase [Sphingomonas laterariae]SNS44844.1 hexosaminidase [Sphingomonas laterariae]